MTLRDYQAYISTDAAKLLEWCKIAYLSMQVRTGKTLTALAAADKYFLNTVTARQFVATKLVLFVTKKKAIESIEDDYEELKSNDSLFYKLNVINYEQLHNYEGDPDLIILDEAHCLGQFPKPAERTKLLKLICEDKPIIYLSGTPTPESWSQLYHQLYVSSFSPFKEYSNFYKWAADYVKVKKMYRYNREFNDYSIADKQKIDAATKHLFISYTQEEAGFKQEVQEEVLLVRMKNETYSLAERLKRDRVFVSKKSGKEVIADTEVKLMNKLHQIYSGSVITEDGEAQIFDNSKADFIREYFRGQKIAIMYKYKAEYAMLVYAFGYNTLTESPEEFNMSDDKIFLSQIQSGAMGVNLSTADALVMFNIDYSNVLYWQARARLQTKDRIKPAKVYWVFAENGIEHKIYEAVKDKKDYVLSYFKKDFNIKKELVK